MYQQEDIKNIRLKRNRKQKIPKKYRILSTRLNMKIKI